MSLIEKAMELSRYHTLAWRSSAFDNTNVYICGSTATESRIRPRLREWHGWLVTIRIDFLLSHSSRKY